ncbi:MAG TPA: VOC family protein [Stellaceae bacterium]|nr:VOC family protein [Stellaceae bacterium]
MVKVLRMGHASFETPDLERLTDYYLNVLGLVLIEKDAKTAYLSCPGDVYSVVLHQANGEPRGTKLSLQISPEADMKEVARELRDAGCEVQQRSDSEPLISDVVAFRDPAGLQVELYKAIPSCGRWEEGAGIIRPDKLGHTAFYVPGVHKDVEFYTSVLGFRVSDWNGDFFCFLRCNVDHHTVNLHEAPKLETHHIAFELRDWNRLRDASDWMARHGTPPLWGPLRLGAGHNLATFHRNPDGHLVELFCEMDRMSCEELGYFDPRPWHADNPQRPKTWLPDDKHANSRRWGQARPSEQRRSR